MHPTRDTPPVINRNLAGGRVMPGVRRLRIVEMKAEERKKVEDALAHYIGVLVDGLRHTSRANDRQVYVAHLAEAAIMFALVHRGEPLSRLKEKVAAEGRSYGWGYLQGGEGEAAEGAFHMFAALVESL